MNGCEVTFEGSTGSGTYTVSADMVQYINDQLVNDGYNGTIYLYPADSVPESRTVYIALQSGLKPRYYNGSGYGYTIINNVENVEFNMESQVMRAKPILDLGFQFLISVFVLCKIFSR